MQKVSIPDKVIVHQAEQCKVCGRKFLLEEVSELVCTRQVFDIPEPKFQVSEHQVRGIRCCGVLQVGQFPLDITAPVQYGKRINLFGQAINARVIIEANEELYEKMKRIEEQIKEELLNSFEGVKHVLCNAHILRELNALIENGSQWAKAMQDLLLEAYRRHQEGQSADISQQAEQEEPLPEVRSRPKNSKGRNLLNRLKAY